MEDTEKIKLLEAELEEKSDEVIKVAQIGKTLLEANGTLQNQLEEMRLTNIKQIEELEQEKFSLNKKLEAKFAMEVNYLEEIENLKSSLTKQKEKSEELLQIELSGKLTEIRNKFENSRAEVERLTLIEKQLKTELEQVNLSFKTLQEKNQQQENISNETFSEEMVKLHSDLSTAYQIKADLEHEIQQINNRNQQLSMNKQHLEEKVERLKGTIEEKDCTIVSYQNTIEKTQEEMIDLQIQLDAAQMEQTDLKKKGNSLFSEVEDRRLNVEKEFINLRVENESVTQQLKMSQQQMHQLKLQMFGMLDMAESKVDRTHLHWLEKQLSRSREEVEQLTNKLQHIEKQTTGRTDDMVNFHQAFSNNSKSDSYYMDFMKAKLKSKDLEMENIKKELHSKSMLQLSESDKCQSLAHKLYVTETELENIRKTNRKMKLQIDELKLKYEPDQFLPKQTLQVFSQTIPEKSVKTVENKENFVESFVKLESPGNVTSNTAPAQSILTTYNYTDSTKNITKKNSKSNLLKSINSSKKVSINSSKKVSIALPDVDKNESVTEPVTGCAVSESATSDPVTVCPASEEPVTGQPVLEEPVTGQPVLEEPVTGQPVSEEPVTGQSVSEEPVTGQSVSEEPVTGQSVSEEPVTGQPVSEEPVRKKGERYSKSIKVSVNDKENNECKTQ